MVTHENYQGNEALEYDYEQKYGGLPVSTMNRPTQVYGCPISSPHMKFGSGYGASRSAVVQLALTKCTRPSHPRQQIGEMNPIPRPPEDTAL